MGTLHVCVTGDFAKKRKCLTGCRLYVEQMSTVFEKKVSPNSSPVASIAIDLLLYLHQINNNKYTVNIRLKSYIILNIDGFVKAAGQ